MKLPALDPINQNLDTSSLELDLAEFVKYAWKIVEPAKPFIGGWHIDLMSEYLMAISSHQIKDLLILVPPRHMKSTLVSVIWPTWVWINEPAHRFITTSYSGKLATRDSVRSRRIISSLWYQRNFGNRFKLTSDQNVKNRYDNNKTGYRIADGVGGALTGEGGDTIICDDPHNLNDIHSTTIRESTVKWWNEVMSTRLNDVNTSSQVVVMQRGHMTDLAGDIIDKGDYEVLKLPAVAEKRAVVSFPVSLREVVREKDDLLCPERFNQRAIAKLKKTLGIYASAAQLQQRPTPIEGGIFKGHWWKYYRELPTLIRIVQFWDTAFKKNQTNDFSACITIGMTEIEYYVMNVWRKRVEFPELKRRAVENYNRYKPDKLLVEDKASGPSLVQSLKLETILPIIAVSVETDKVSRANAVSPTVEAGKVFLLEGAPWLADFKDELENFPNAPNDDQVDAFDGAMAELMGITKNKVGTPKFSRL